jgi:hypothetical protein
MHSYLYEKRINTQHGTAHPTLDVTYTRVAASEEISLDHNKENELELDVHGFYSQRRMQTNGSMCMKANDPEYILDSSGLGLHRYMLENSRFFYLGDQLIKVEDRPADCTWFKRHVHVVMFLYLFLSRKEHPREHRCIRDQLTLKAIGWGPPH